MHMYLILLYFMKYQHPPSEEDIMHLYYIKFSVKFCNFNLSDFLHLSRKPIAGEMRLHISNVKVR